VDVFSKYSDACLRFPCAGRRAEISHFAARSRFSFRPINVVIASRTAECSWAFEVHCILEVSSILTLFSSRKLSGSNLRLPSKGSLPRASQAGRRTRTKLSPNASIRAPQGRLVVASCDCYLDLILSDQGSSPLNRTVEVQPDLALLESGQAASLRLAPPKLQVQV
jgi:hypothetical protein